MFGGRTQRNFLRKGSARKTYLAGLTAAILGAGVGAAALSTTLMGCVHSAYDRDPNDVLRSYALALEEGRVDDAYALLSDDAKRSISLEAFRRAANENPTEVLDVARSLRRPTTSPVVEATLTTPGGDDLHLLYEDGKWRVDANAVDLYSQATPKQALVGFIRAFERKRYDVILRLVPDAEREGIDADDDAPAAPSASPGPAVPPAPTVVASAAPSTSASTAAPSTSSSASAGPASSAPTSVLGSGNGALTPELIKEAWEGPLKERMTRVIRALKAALANATIDETGESATMAYGSGNLVTFVRERGDWKIKDF